MRRAAACPLMLAALTLAGSGCVQQDRYDTLLHENRSLREQNLRVTEERDTAQGNLENLRAELGHARGEVQNLERKNQGLDDEFRRIEGDYDNLLDKVSALDIGPLPPDVELALENLASSYSSLLAFDARRGMLRFSSDFTFALGSVELQPDAQATIAAVADIFNSETAASLEVKVVGHTDNVPIGKPETLRAHPTNLHLSVHRAIAVSQALAEAGVEPVRMQVAGYGELRPIVPNGRRGAAANRRVEVFLTPMDPATPRPPAPSAEATPAEAPVSNEPMK